MIFDLCTVPQDKRMIICTYEIPKDKFSNVIEKPEKVYYTK